MALCYEDCIFEFAYKPNKLHSMGDLQKNVDENWEAAIEYNPEAFARVVWLNTILGLW